MASVTYRNVYKNFDDVEVVKNFDLDIQDNEFVVFVGPSGCGKSTSLRMLAGLEEVTKGEIYIGDRLVNDVHPKDRDLAMVFQSYALYPHMSVYDNMAFALKLAKQPKSEIDKKVRAAADILGLNEYLERKPKALSGGQRQRVAVGRAIVREPSVFLMDEPLSNLDAKLRVSARAEITKLHERLGTTFIYVTHDQVEAMTMGDRIVVLKDGILQQVDTPRNLYNRPDNIFVAGFIGSPSMNFFDGRVTASDDGVAFDAGSFKVDLPASRKEGLASAKDKTLVLGVRPEHIYSPEYAPPSITAATIKAKVEMVELLGSELHVYCKSGESNFVATVDSRKEVHMGDEIELVMDMSACHVFDKTTEKAIR